MAGIQLAREMGHYVVVSDISPKAPAFSIADDYFLADVYGVEDTVLAARRYHENVRPIDGVMCIAADVPHVVAAVADDLGLPGITLDAARLAVNKLEMKQVFRQDGVPIPEFYSIGTVDDLRTQLARIGGCGVLKPIDSRGGRGVILLSETVDLEWAFKESIKHSPSSRVMLEQYLPGPQVSTESIIVEGKAYTPGFSDRNYEYMEKYAPYFIENGGSLPSVLSADICDSVCELVEVAAKSLGIINGVVKGDIVIHQGKPYVIELAARLSGGYFCTHEIPLNTGVSTVAAVIKQSLGKNICAGELTPQFLKPVAQRYLFVSPGKVKFIRGCEKVRNLSGVHQLVLSVREGDTVVSSTGSDVRVAMVITEGKSIKDAIEIAENAIDLLDVVVE